MVKNNSRKKFISDDQVHLKFILIIFILTCFLSKNSLSSENDDHKDSAISDGSRIHVEEKHFSIVPPDGWEIHRDYPNTSLLLQIPFRKGLSYQRTIQIMVSKGPRYIDDITSREFESVLTTKYSKVSRSIKDYKVRNHLMTRMSDGREGILYYAEFMLEDKKMMQAHILLSSDKYSYLLTYTDLAEHFEGDDSSEYLTKAWSSMTSIKFDGDAPVRFQNIFRIALVIMALLILLILVYLVRNFRAGKSYAKQMHADDILPEDFQNAQKKEKSSWDHENFKTTPPPDDRDDSDDSDQNDDVWKLPS